MDTPAAVAEIAARYAADLAALPDIAARKRAGAYYTPASLVECLLDSALQPQIDEARTPPHPADRVHRLREITVCDPACGAGAFLIAAARRIGRALAEEMAAWHSPHLRGPFGLPDPTPASQRRAVRAVIATQIHGVDLVETSAELAKAVLWLEAFDPDRPNAFLNDKIRVGNALLGTTPALLAAGIPDAAYTALDGDDKRVATELRRRNKAERGHTRRLEQPTPDTLF